MVTWLLGLLPDVLHWLPIATGVSGGIAGIFGLSTNLRTYALIALGVLLAISVGAALWYRGEYEACQAARATAIAEAQKRADDLANKLLNEQLKALNTTEKTVTVYRDRIINAPTTNTCGPAVRDALRGVCAISGGCPNDQRGTAPALR